MTGYERAALNFSQELLEDLRKLRLELARQRKVPAYIIFGDATLHDLARKCPTTPEGLLHISVIGLKKLEQKAVSLRQMSSPNIEVKQLASALPGIFMKLLRTENEPLS
jgi:superfamily II DNA helicase RecQ